METYDVIIVGGGPAGSTCARMLQNSQVDYLLLDKATFPRTKLCAGWITPEVISDLEIDIDSYPHGFLTFDKLCFHFPAFGFKSGNAQHSIRRYEFDAWLLDRSAARVKQHDVRRIGRQGDCYVVDDVYRCTYLVGAGGTRCPVYRNIFREANPRSKNLQAVTLEEEYPYEYQDGRCHLWFFGDGLPGYAWYVPKADGYVNIGIGGMADKLKQRSDDIKPHWQSLVSRLESTGLVSGNGISPGGYSYFVRGDADAGRIDNAFILGDAAGLATRDLCEGIGPAVKSGMMAADCIVNGSDYDLSSVARYSIDSFLTRKLFEFKLHSP